MKILQVVLGSYSVVITMGEKNNSTRKRELILFLFDEVFGGMVLGFVSWYWCQSKPRP